MAEFSDRDLNRSYAKEELRGLSEKDLTKLTFHRNAKNLAFFGIGALFIAYIASALGTVGTVIGWISIAIYCLFALEPLLGFLTTVISLLAPVPGKQWRLLQAIISGSSAALYIIFALYIYNSR